MSCLLQERGYNMIENQEILIKEMKKTENQEKSMQLLKQQVGILYRYEEVIYERLYLELSI